MQCSPRAAVPQQRARCEGQRLPPLDCFGVGVEGGRLVASSCWEFWVECALEYPSWRKSRGLLGALTSQTAPGNALHSSSWQLLGHFQKGWGKKHSGIIFWSIWDQRVEGAKGLRLKTHGSLRVSLALAPLSSLLVSFPEITRWKRGPPPPNTHSPLRFQRMTLHINWHPSILPQLV